MSKAFDSVPRERLLLKLEAIGISGQLLIWIHSFLTCRQQRVLINGNYSSWWPIRSVIPIHDETYKTTYIATFINPGDSD